MMVLYQVIFKSYITLKSMLHTDLLSIAVTQRCYAIHYRKQISARQRVYNFAIALEN